METVVLKLRMKNKLEAFFKKHVYSGGYFMSSKEERFFTYEEASKPFYRVGNA